MSALIAVPLTQQKTWVECRKNKLRMRESKIEKEFRKQATAAGWWCLKLAIIAHAGFPDRLLLKHPGRVKFAELKATGKDARPLQGYIHRKLRKLGFEVYVINRVEDITRVIES